VSSNILSEPVPPTNSDTSRVKYEGLSTTGGGDAEVFEDLASVYVLRPCNTCILVFRRTKRQRDGGPTKVGVARRQRRTEENRGEFAGGIQADIRTEGQSPQRAEYLYFTSDMYSNREAEERHSGEVAESLRMTNG